MIKQTCPFCKSNLTKFLNCTHCKIHAVNDHKFCEFSIKNNKFTHKKCKHCDLFAQFHLSNNTLLICTKDWLPIVEFIVNPDIKLIQSTALKFLKKSYLL